MPRHSVGQVGSARRALFVLPEFTSSVQFTINYRDRVAGEVTVAHQGDVEAMRTIDSVTRKED
jgi:hypothetical protein